jgi:hypothetical protein
MNQQKDNNSTQFWATIIIIAVVALVVFILRYNSSIDWTETYRHNLETANKNPFDLSILRAALSSEPNAVKDLESKLSVSLPKEGEGENFIFVGEAMRLDSTDAKGLRNFIERGNTALISSKYISKRLLKHLIINEIPIDTSSIATEQDSTEINESEMSNDTTTNENLTVITPDEMKDIYEKYKSSNGIEYQNIKDSNFVSRIFATDTLVYHTGYYNAMEAKHFPVSLLHLNHIVANSLLKDVKPLGDLQQKYVNFVTIPYGRGKLLLHSTPIFFSNVEIIDPKGKEHIEHILAYLPKGKIYWDKYSQTDISTARLLDQDNAKQDKNYNMLKYIIGHRSLASAWYLLLATALLFLIFGAKRRQRIIPVLQEKTNTSLTYIQALGRLYFRQQNHTGLANMKFKHFLAYVRQRYGINTTQFDEPFFFRLAQKSGIDIAHIRQLIEKAQYAERLPIDENYLTAFHQDLELFYSNCK